MRSDVFRPATIALALAAGLAVAAAQTPPPDTSKPDQNATQEPTTKTNADTQPNVLSNGALNVPGAPTNTDTVPAKFSAKNAADDSLPISGYTFKPLSNEQRRAIYDAVKAAGASNAKAGTPSYDVSALLPADIPLAPLPDEIAAQIPQTRNYSYAMAGDKVLLVDPTNRVVVGVFGR